MRERSKAKLIVLVSVTVILSLSCFAEVSAFYALTTDTVHSNIGRSNGGTFGWAFSVNSPLTITELGYFDSSGDGLDNSHAIGVWDLDENLLGSASVPSGTLATLENGFRWIPISPISLEAGKTYVIGTRLQDSPDDTILRMSDAANLSFDPSITFLEDRYEVWNIGLVYPPAVDGRDITTNLNANFKGIVSSVIEVTFTGSISIYQDDGFLSRAGVVDGDLVLGTFTYDTAETSWASSNGLAQYWPIQYYYTIGGNKVHFKFTSGGMGIVIRNNWGTGAEDSFAGILVGTLTNLATNETHIGSANGWIHDNTGTVLTSIVLPDIGTLMTLINPMTNPGYESFFRNNTGDIDFTFSNYTWAARIAPIPGDLNHDGDVDGDDLAIFSGHFGSELLLP